MNIPCSIHGGPLDGTTLHLHPRVNRLTVPVVIPGDRVRVTRLPATEGG